MKTKPSRRSLLPLVLVAGLAAGCKTADAEAGPATEGAPARNAPGQEAPGDSAPGQGEPDAAPAKAEPTFAWARALDWQTDSLRTATAPNGEMIVVGARGGGGGGEPSVRSAAGEGRAGAPTMVRFAREEAQPTCA